MEYHVLLEMIDHVPPWYKAHAHRRGEALVETLGDDVAVVRECGGETERAGFIDPG